MRSALTAFRPFQVDTPLRNAATIFILTTLFYFVGAELRLVEALSLFWRDVLSYVHPAPPGVELGEGQDALEAWDEFLDRMAGIKRVDQDFGVFGLVICLVERHQAAHSSHTGWPSSVTYASWLRCLTRKHSEQMNSSFCMGMTVTEASSLLRSAPGSS